MPALPVCAGSAELNAVPATNAVVASCVVLVPSEAVGAVGVPVKAGLASVAKPAATNAVVAICVVLVPLAAVGAVGVPVSAGELANNSAPDPDSSVIAAAS